MIKIFIILYSLFIIPLGALAQGGSTGFVTPSDNGLPNPLGITTLAELIDRITGALMTIAIPIVALMIIYGAFQILTAGGDPEGFKKGKNTILYAVIGYAIVLVAKGITAIIKQLLGAP
ncbi:MAG: hypothetical protein A2745_03025 [Candidatus Harrisonbacteria bacterium RIFCSPHIGHO2_01_FULL_44_13]|uniref:TrbC/VIRB2 family protein n=1 Tax=Candidatus Harrisonbacteria bacterium RIFCSPLOWO2_01_FULL_44_18 TaxID=1798407 RepID=A0A1G1ZMF5_9BACT|nr:MAG: hypothetical protein A2745_03025 [Candidatus Harrisonbacteria bacterium RIFCSPHIGHO2_01_FULL_44_13]OGY65754.1 MAG: hypothetical protein A3A16_04050 [Candidatus Harrisonbacteria bacterium RIFCSPLOWO2_01_FULL_44_18]